jgi:hypothetical protein
LRSGTGSGRSLDSTAGRYLLGRVVLVVVPPSLPLLVVIWLLGSGRGTEPGDVPEYLDGSERHRPGTATAASAFVPMPLV